MINALALTFAVLLTVWSATAWFVFIVDWHQRIRQRLNVFPTVLAIIMWVIWANL